MQPILVEFHDATLRSFTARASGSTVVEFGHACVYFELAHERYAVKAYEATLACREVSRLTLSGPWASDDYVSDAALNGSPINTGTTELLMRGVPAATLLMRFGSGLVLEVTAGAIQLQLGREVGQMKDWVGPLHRSD